MSDLLKDAWREMGYSNVFTRSKFIDFAIRSLCKEFNDPVTIKRMKPDSESVWVVAGDGWSVEEFGLAEALATAVLRFKTMRESASKQEKTKAANASFGQWCKEKGQFP